MPTADRERLLLDTHVWLWLLNARGELGPGVAQRIQAAAVAGGVYVQAFSVWEVAMLECKGRIKIDAPLEEWVSRAFALPGISLLPLEPRIAIASARLPGSLHSDPADRIIAASARQHNLTLVTRDAALIAYGRAGHLRVLPA